MDEIKTPKAERRTVLLKTATIAEAVSTHHLSSEAVKGVVSFAIEQKIVTVQSLSRLAGVAEAALANLMSGQATVDDADMQKRILEKVREQALAEANQLGGNKAPERSN